MQLHIVIVALLSRIDSISWSITVAKFAFSFDDTRVTIVDEKSKKVDDKLSLLKHVELSEAFRVLTRGKQADQKASDVAISMLADVLQSPVLDGYKGKTPANEKIPSLLLSAVRDVENDIFKTAFTKAHMEKGATATKADELWQQFRKEELTTGSYSNAKSFVLKLFAHMGQTPVAPNGMLLPLHAVRRMYESWKAEQESSSTNKTIAEKLVTLSSELHTVEGGANMGELPDAIAALKSMLATYETMYTAFLVQRTAAGGGVTQQAQAATNKAKQATPATV